MAKFTGLLLQVLEDRLGRKHAHGMSGSSDLHQHAFYIVWHCNESQAPKCLATARADDRPMPSDLTPWEQELFDKAPLPRDGWTLSPCPHHRGAFPEFPEEPD